MLLFASGWGGCGQARTPPPPSPPPPPTPSCFTAGGSLGESCDFLGRAFLMLCFLLIVLTIKCPSTAQASCDIGDIHIQYTVWPVFVIESILGIFSNLMKRLCGYSLLSKRIR